MKLDLGCGPRPREGFDGVDIQPGDGVKHVVDLRQPWPWADGSVEAVHSSHFVEHLTGAERVHFFNELHRVLAPKAQATIIVPHWSHDCAYGDPTHEWPPISEWTLLYTNAEWRRANAPHTGYTCDFDFTYGHNIDVACAGRSREWLEFAVRHYRNVIREIHATLTRRG